MKKERIKIPFAVLRLILEKEPLYLMWSVLQILTGSALPLLTVYVPKRILESITGADPFGETVRVILLCSAVLLLLQGLHQVFSNRSELAAWRFAAKLRFEIAETTMRLELKDIETATQRKIIKMANNAAGLTGMLGTLRQMTSNIITIVGLAWIAVRLHVWFLLAISAVLAVKTLFSVLQFRFNKRARELYAKNDRVGDYLTGLAYFNQGAEKELRVNDLQEWFMGKILRYRGEMVRLQYRDFRRSALFETVISVMRTAQALAVLLILTDSYLGGAIGIADFTMYFSTVTSLTAALSNLTYQIRRYHEQVLNFTDYQAFLDLLHRAGPEEASDEEPPTRTEIAFEDVTFAYPGSDQNVLEHLDLTIRNGETLMIVGANGSGKTTLIKLLCKLYRPTSGRITLNGRDIWEIPNDVYYRTIGAVFQNTRNFAFSLAENVSLTEEADRGRVREILGELGLGTWLEGLPGGPDTCLTRQFSPDGVELSGGQDQKLAIARAIYKDAPLLILDEPTASLDARAESAIYTDFGRMTQGKTTVLISHRLAAAMLAERIVVLDGGRIAESGTHAALIRHGGLYAEMYAAQSRAYVGAEV